MTTTVLDTQTERLATLAACSGDTPDLVIDLGALQTNVDRIAAAAAAHGVGVRPHIKTHKLIQVARMQMNAGAVGIQVAKLGEAEVMVEAGILDVLVGYPIVGKAKVERLVGLAELARVTVSLDALEVARPIAEAAERRGVELNFLIEIDTGLSRIGVPPGEEAIGLAEQVAALPATHLIGVLTHEGHAYTRAGSEEELRTITREACERTVATARELRTRGTAAPVISVGSSGTFRFAIEVDGVTEVRPGTYVFNDRTQIGLGAATPADVAAVVVATVVSGHRAGEVVLDAGSKALTSDRMISNSVSDTFGLVAADDGSVGEIVRLSEEHAVASFPQGVKAPGVGERVAIIPNHICPVVNLFEKATVTLDGAVVDRWPVAARGLLR